MYCKCTAWCANCSASTGLLRGRSLQGADWGLLPRSHLHQRHSEIQKFGGVKRRLSMSLSNLMAFPIEAFHGFSVSMAPRKHEKTTTSIHQPSEAVQSCCGGQTLYDSETHGCCLEKGPQVENQAKTKEKKQHLTILMYFDAISRLSLFWILEILVLQLRILRDELLPFFLQQWKQKCRSSESKDASLQRTFSNCNGNVRIESHWDICCPRLGIGTEHCSARCTLMAATIAADGPKASVVSVLAKRVAAADVTDPCSLARSRSFCHSTRNWFAEGAQHSPKTSQLSQNMLKFWTVWGVQPSRRATVGRKPENSDN